MIDLLEQVLVEVLELEQAGELERVLVEGPKSFVLSVFQNLYQKIQYCAFRVKIGSVGTANRLEVRGWSSYDR